jgi:predicted ATPase
MKVSLAEYVAQSASMRVERFCSLCFPICDFIETQHRKGKVLVKLNPDVIYVDPQTKQVELRYDSNRIDRFLPYISPEQTGRINRQVDCRSDLYSLGIIFYELLTGELPLQAEDVLGWSYAHMTIEPKPPSELNAEVPLVLSGIIMKLLSKSPDKRYQSIAGLTADLKRCCVEWHAIGETEPFILGQMDVSERLQAQNRLFGRDQEIAILMDAYDRVCQGNMESVIISGYSGVGKTALVNEFRNKITYSKGYFVCGRFSQSQHDTPYLGVSQVICELVEQIIVDRWQDMSDWENMSRGMLDADEGILTQAIPELKRLIEEDLSVQDMFSGNSKDRLLELSRCLLRTIHRAEHPVVVFLDDLQWVDPTSLKLIQALIPDASKGCVLLIGAYHTNEVDETQSVFSMIQSLEDQHIPVTYMMLQALDLNSTQELVADILTCKEKDMMLLATGIFMKSAGNPLFVKQIIRHLYAEGHLYFSSQEWCWKYKHGGLRSIVLQERVVKLVLERIPKLPVETIDLLKLTSCLGREFDLGVLSISLNQPVDWLRQILEPAVNLGIITEQSGFDSAGDLEDHNENTNSQGRSFTCFEFLHDRVVEAVYSLMSDAERKIAHLEVGRAILQKSGSVPDGDSILAAVNHLNHSIELIDEEKERIQLAAYNLKAVTEAKVSAESTVLLQYLEAGMRLLPENSWKSYYRLTFDLHIEYYRCRFLQEGFLAAEPIFELLKREAKSQADRIELYCQRTVLCVGYYTDEEAILSGLSALKYLGLRIPIVPDKRYLVKEILYIRLRLFGRKIEFLLHYPEMRNDRARKIMAILANLVPPASLSNPELFKYILLKMTSISLKYGNTDYAAFAYVCYGFICSQFGDVNSAMKLRDISLALAEEYGNCAIRCKVYYTIAVYLNHWHTHLSKNLDYAGKAHYYARESGDALLVGSIQTEMVQVSCMLGQSLSSIYQQNMTALSQNMLYSMPDLLDILHTVNQYIRNLKGDTFDPFTFSSADYDEDTVAGRMIRTNSGIIVPFYYLMKMQSFYLHGKLEESFMIALQLHSNLDLIDGKMLYAEHVYWACLTASAAYAELEAGNKNKAKKLWQKNIRLLQKWSRMCEENFLHKYSLVSAEQHRLNGNTQKAMTFYEKAINVAQKNGYILDAAVACERTAEFYLELGFHQNAQVHMVSACRLYAEFGATLKLTLLRAKYPEMLAGIECALLQEHEGTDKDNADSTEKSTDDNAAEDLRVMPEVCAEVDYAALSEVVSNLLGNSDFDDFARKLLGVIVKSAGAQRAYLMEVRGDSVVTIARKDSGQEPVLCHEKEPGNDCRSFSHSVVMYVINTGKPVVLDDSAENILFAKDRYFRETQTKSVLCLPVSSEDGLVGVLYLENNSAIYFDTQSRKSSTFSQVFRFLT